MVGDLGLPGAHQGSFIAGVLGVFMVIAGSNTNKKKFRQRICHR